MRMHALSLSTLALAFLAIAPTARAAELGYNETRADAEIRGPWAAEALLGSGLGGTQGIAYGARLGYGVPDGIYLGGEAARDARNDNADTLLGGDVGYRAFPTRTIEVRPFTMIGASIPTTGTTQLAVQPGVLAAYHFGAAYVSAEARLRAVPTPVTPALLVGAGLTF